MKCGYWCQGDVCPAEKKVDKDFKKNRAGKRAFDDRLRDLQDASYDECQKQDWIKPVKGSKQKLLQWVINLPNGTARMFLVLHQNSLWFLHFFIKKSRHKIETPRKEVELAESRAKMFWDYQKKLEQHEKTGIQRNKIK